MNRMFNNERYQHLQVIIPNLTDSYSLEADPLRPVSIPIASIGTLTNFPYSVDHTLMASDGRLLYIGVQSSVV